MIYCYFSASNYYSSCRHCTVLVIGVSDLEFENKFCHVGHSVICTLSFSVCRVWTEKRHLSLLFVHFRSRHWCDSSLPSLPPPSTRSRIIGLHVRWQEDMVSVFMVYFYLCVFLLTDSCCGNCRHFIWGTFIHKRSQSFLFQGIHTCLVFYVFIFVLMIQVIGRVVHCKSNGNKHTKSNCWPET